MDDARARAGLVDQIDRLVGQETAGDVAVGKLGRRLEGHVGEVTLWWSSYLVPETLEDRDRVSIDGRLLDTDRLEAAFQGGVLLDVLAVLVERRGAHALELAAGKRGLEDVGGVHRALGGAGADDRVELVDEEDDVPGALDLVHDGLDPLLELAAVLRPRDHEREVERDDLLLEEDLGDVAGGDLLGQALDDRGLAHAGLADQTGLFFVRRRGSA